MLKNLITRVLYCYVSPWYSAPRIQKSFLPGMNHGVGGGQLSFYRQNCKWTDFRHEEMRKSQFNWHSTEIRTWFDKS